MDRLAVNEEGHAADSHGFQHVNSKAVDKVK